jgi:hypothetical protein
MRSRGLRDFVVVVCVLTFMFMCLCSSSDEHYFLLEVEGFRRVKLFEFYGPDDKCPIDRHEFSRAAKSLVDVFELDEGRFWIRASDFSVVD